MHSWITNFNKKYEETSKELKKLQLSTSNPSHRTVDLANPLVPGSNGETRALEVRAVGRAGRTDCVKGAALNRMEQRKKR